MVKISGANTVAKCCANWPYSSCIVLGNCEGLPNLHDHPYELLVTRGNETEGNAPVEKSTQGIICPLFRLPPLTSLSIIFIRRNNVIRNTKINDFEKELTPRNDWFWTLLMCAQMDSDTCFIGFEDKVKHGWCFLCSTGWLLQEFVGDINESREEWSDEFRKDIVLLSEPNDTRWSEKRL